MVQILALLSRSTGMANSNQGREDLAKKKRYLRMAIILAIIILLNVAGAWLGRQVNFQLFPRHDSMLQTILLIAILIYIVLMATPFMPGIEVGLAIMLMLGSKSALLIYLCTLIALSISYMIGKYFPLQLVHRLLRWLYLHKASALVSRLEPLNQQERLKLVYEKAPKRFAPFLLDHRYATIAVLLNLPGNALLGGGGGIGLVIGMSRLIPFHKYFLLISLAVAPVPLGLYLQEI
jgi:hypothetical protein